MAAAGASSQGASARAPACAASCSITPQLGVGSANPKPTKDSVASARMNAGISSVACTARNPLAAGSRCRSRIRHDPAPIAPAASAYSLPSLRGHDRPHATRGVRPARQAQNARHRPEHLRRREDQRHRGPQDDHDVDDGEDEDEIGHAHQAIVQAASMESGKRADERTEQQRARGCRDRDAERQARAKDHPREDVAPERVPPEHQPGSVGIGVDERAGIKPDQRQPHRTIFGKCVLEPIDQPHGIHERGVTCGRRRRTGAGASGARSSCPGTGGRDRRERSADAAAVRSAMEVRRTIPARERPAVTPVPRLGDRPPPARDRTAGSRTPGSRIRQRRIPPPDRGRGPAAPDTSDPRAPARTSRSRR